MAYIARRFNDSLADSKQIAVAMYQIALISVVSIVIVLLTSDPGTKIAMLALATTKPISTIRNFHTLPHGCPPFRPSHSLQTVRSRPRRRYRINLI